MHTHNYTPCTHTLTHTHAYHFQATISGFASEEKASEIEQFFRENPWDAARMLVKQNCEAIRLNASWLGRDSESVRSWLAQAQWQNPDTNKTRVKYFNIFGILILILVSCWFTYTQKWSLHGTHLANNLMMITGLDPIQCTFGSLLYSVTHAPPPPPSPRDMCIRE